MTKPLNATGPRFVAMLFQAFIFDPSVIFVRSFLLYLTKCPLKQNIWHKAEFKVGGSCVYETKVQN